MNTTTPAELQVEAAGFWSSRPVSKALLAVVSIFVAVSVISDVIIRMSGSGPSTVNEVLVSLLVSLAIFTLWSRTTFAFAAMVPALLSSHLLQSFNVTSIALPFMLGAVTATARRSFSLMALGISLVWAVLVPLTSPKNSSSVWVVVPLLIGAWGIGTFVRYILDRGQQDRLRVVEATRRAAMAAAEERRSLARDLHDIVAHNLTIISMQARAAKYAGTDEAARQAVDIVGDSATEALADLRRMLSLLQAEGLLAGDREAAKMALGDGAAALDLEYGAVKFRRMLEGLGIQTELDLVGLDQAIPQSVETALYRVLQEAVTNVAKHAAEGGQCRICIRVDDGHLQLAVDNTLPRRGERARAGWNSSGSGLIGMRDRVDAFGGTMSSVRDGNWWRVRAEVPLQDIPA